MGSDVSKDHLDVLRLPGGERGRSESTPTGYKALIKHIGPTPARVACEPTGAYIRKLEVRLATAGMPIVNVNPRQARRCEQAAGGLAKTDTLDAAMLARMGAVLGLEARPVRDAILNTLKDLHLAREALVKDRPAARSRAKRAMAVSLTPVDDIPGIGATRKRALLQHFGSAKAVARAGLSDLQAVDGISEAMAKTIADYFSAKG